MLGLRVCLRGGSRPGTREPRGSSWDSWYRLVVAVRKDPQVDTHGELQQVDGESQTRAQKHNYANAKAEANSTRKILFVVQQFSPFFLAGDNSCEVKAPA